mmetsp:Transcript_5819/g.13744  ORF Transcript_5819/g.13744 Transcript_5819/m.13744 type:complete len:335 (+) Transcript_5819:741-1745(+)
MFSSRFSRVRSRVTRARSFLAMLARRSSMTLSSLRSPSSKRTCASSTCSLRATTANSSACKRSSAEHNFSRCSLLFSSTAASRASRTRLRSTAACSSSPARFCLNSFITASSTRNSRCTACCRASNAARVCFRSAAARSSSAARLCPDSFAAASSACSSRCTASWRAWSCSLIRSSKTCKSWALSSLVRLASIASCSRARRHFSRSACRFSHSASVLSFISVGRTFSFMASSDNSTVRLFRSASTCLKCSACCARVLSQRLWSSRSYVRSSASMHPRTSTSAWWTAFGSLGALAPAAAAKMRCTASSVAPIKGEALDRMGGSMLETAAQKLRET